MIELLRNVWLDEEGQDLAEYGMLIALIAVAVIVAVTAFGNDLKTFFTGVGTKLGLPLS